MSEQVTQTKKKFVHPGYIIDNSFNNPVEQIASDCSESIATICHMERDGNGIKIVEDGKVDRQAEIQAQSCNAGLQNIIRLQTMRYGTIENAIARNADKQVFADVSKIPTSIAEQADYVASIQKDVDELANKLGITKEELLKANQEFLANKLAGLNNAPADAEGGNENV